MKRDSDPSPAPRDDPPDPVVARLAAELRASSLPAARALVPLSAEERSALADRLLGPAEQEAPSAPSPGAGVEQAAPAPPEKAPSAAAAPRASGPASTVATAPRSAARPRRRWWPVALAAAFVLAAFVWQRTATPPAPVAYQLRVFGDVILRGDPPPPTEAALRLRPSTRLLVVLAPTEPIPDASLRMLVVRDGKARIVRPPFENDGLGKLTIDRPAREALGDQVDGAAELVWIAGRPMPADAEIERIAADPGARPPPGTAVLRRAVVFEDWGGASLSPGSVEMGGCKAAIRGPRCEMDAGAELVLWAPIPAGEAAVHVDGQPANARTGSAAAGTRWTVTVPGGAREVVLSSPRLSSPLRVAIAAAPAVPAEITAAAALVQKNQLREAEALLAGLPPGSASSAVAITRLRARIARRGGDPARAEGLFGEAADRAAEGERLSDEIENRCAVAHQAIVYRRDHAAAEAALAAAGAAEAACRAECTPWRADVAYYRGLLAKERGRYAEALSELGAARGLGERLGLPDTEGMVLQPLAGLLSIFGRDAEAIELLERARALSPETPCERGSVLTNLAWAEHRGAATRAARERAADLAGEALRMLEGGSCAHVLGTAQVNAALLQAAAGRVEEAGRGLVSVRKAARDDARLAPWLIRLEMDLARAADPTRALAEAARLEQDAARDGSPELRFEAALGRAETLDALGRTGETDDAYREAARREAEWAAAAPLGEGRASFLERQRSAFRAWVDFAARKAEGAPDPAARRAAALDLAQVVRWSLGRFAATLAAAPPSPPRGPAPPPPAGEAHLYYHPVRDGWIGVAVTEAQSKTVRFPAVAPRRPPGGAVAAALLAPFEEILERAGKVVVFADRALRDVTFQDLPWRGGVLSDHAPVAYGTGVVAGVEPPPGDGCGSRPQVVLVLDPSRNLAGARRTGERLGERLGARASVLAGEQATRKAVIDALSDPCARLFQIDGHAVFGGKDGTGAALELADGPLTARDLLDATVVARVPATVVLSGCETGREEGLGVAHAFLQRGSRQVLATTAPVDDALSARLMEALHDQAPAPGSEWDLATSLRAALLALRGRGAGAGPWSPFRILVP